MIPFMRMLEIILIVLGLLLVLFEILPEDRKKQRPLLRPALAGFSVLATALHFFIEGYRWQMVPIYLAISVGIVLGLSGYFLARKYDPQTIRRRLGGLGGLLLLALGLALGVLFPVPRVPPLTGPFPVGTTTLYLKDPSRPEIYTEDPADTRELMVQIWYPAAPLDKVTPGPWMAEAAVAGPAIARRLDLPSFLLDHLQLVHTHAALDVPPTGASGPFPVLLFSHGWGGLRTQNVTQVEELASQGYVVAAADHTYSAVVTVFPGARAALWKPEILPNNANQAVYDAASNQMVRVWAQDLDFILDHLERINSGASADPFAGLLDLKNVGIIGHSTGGGAAVEWCAQDLRCQAGFTMDAWLEPVTETFIEAGLEQPFLYLRSEAWEQPDRNPRNDRLLAELMSSSGGPAYRLVVAGTAHYDFSSLPLFSPLAPALGLKGPIPGPRINQIVNEYTRAFFARHLGGEEEMLLDGPAGQFPEVQYK